MRVIKVSETPTAILEICELLEDTEKFRHKMKNDRALNFDDVYLERHDCLSYGEINIFAFLSALLFGSIIGVFVFILSALVMDIWFATKIIGTTIGLLFIIIHTIVGVVGCFFIAKGIITDSENRRNARYVRSRLYCK